MLTPATQAQNDAESSRMRMLNASAVVLSSRNITQALARTVPIASSWCTSSSITNNQCGNSSSAIINGVDKLNIPVSVCILDNYIVVSQIDIARASVTKSCDK